MNTAPRLVHRDDESSLFPGEPALGWATRLREALSRSESRTLLLVAPGVRPDAFTVSGLREALEADPALAAASPVAIDEVRDAWNLDDTADAVLEAWTWAPHTALAATPDPRCALWSRAAAERLLASGILESLPGACLPHLATALPRADTPPVVDAGWRPARLVRTLPPPTTAGRDGRPVILHVLHDWGGGVARFVADQMRDDPEATHLALVSCGGRGRGFGRLLALHVDLAACPIRAWPCRPAIGDLADHHPIAHAALREAIDAFGVSAVRVSSLIGHSLDVLRTGLPTSVVVHDLFPFWPCLDEVDPSDRWDADRLAEAARDPGWLFAERRPEAWRARADAMIAALSEAEIDVVAPSESAARRLAAFAPGLAVAAVIPHGLPDSFSGGSPRGPERRPGPLRVIVPGHLRGGKGQTLLDRLLPLCPPGIEWWFIGGETAAARYAEAVGGHAIEKYAPEDLPGLVAGIDPDLALLPSLLPETFGYVLSEMQALGVPALAAARGAYAERASIATTGLAPVAPEPRAFAEVLRQWASDPTPLPRRLPPPMSLGAARRAWSGVRPWRVAPTHLSRDPAVALLKHAEGMLLAENAWLARERDTAYLAHARDTGDLIQQRDVAMARAETLMQEQARERAQFAAHSATLESEVRFERERIVALRNEQADERSRLEAEVEAIRLQVFHLREEREALRATQAEARARWEAEIDATRGRLDQLRREREALDGALAALRASVDDVEQQLGNARRERDQAYGYYERDTSDLIRQRDIALSQRDAAQEQLDRARRTLAHPLVHWPLRAREKAGDAVAAWRYRLDRGVDLGRRGFASLRQRGIAATWAAVLRRFRPPADLLPQATVDAHAPLAFESPDSVQASVVIPVHGKLDYTLACLRSLARTGLPAGTEVIVVDDASPDDSGDVLPRIPGLRYHRNARNLGFVGSCNAGASMARGEFLVFLNNDTTLTPGWLDALLATFESHPDTGLAGAQLVYPDGRLQESGGIVFADGSGWNYGRFEDPQHPAYTFVREVDYCSGAAIALPRALFARLGGFDERYAPAYYEDTDLAMKVREAGLKVRVQPASVVVHHEGVTAGTDTGSGVKACQVRNQQRFVERWRDTLVRRHPAPTQAPHYAAQHRARARVLVIDATTPMPDRDSGSVRLFELLRLLVDEGCAVTFFPENGLDDGRYTQALRALGVEAWTQPWLGALPDWLAKHGPRFQLIVVSRHYVLSPLLPLLRRHAPQARIVFDTVDLHHLREQREAEERGDPALLRAAARTRADELALIGRVDRTWVVSPVEKALLAETLPGATVDVVSNIHRVRGRGPAMQGRHGLLFVGGFRHPPNVDAATWLADDILPRIRALRPEITLSLVGSDAPPEILALGEREGITVHGHVPDLEPLIDAHRFSVAPLRYGAGVKGKINQALAHGLPVVATSCAVEGMGLKDGIDALVADDAAAFAATVLRAYDDADLWKRLVEGGLANTEREFSPERARATLRAIFSELR